MSYVRVGPRLELRQVQDRWGAWIDQWEAPYYGWIDLLRWERVKDYQSPPAECFAIAAIWWLTFRRLSPIPASVDEVMELQYSKEIERKLQLNPQPSSTIWQMDLQMAPTPAGGYIRMCAALCEERLVEWTDHDAEVVLPRLQVEAYEKNQAHLPPKRVG